MRRNEIPEPLADPATWPGVDASALDADRRELYRQREAAVYAWLAGSSLAGIERRFKINRGALKRLVERCLLPHDDGRTQGLRALIPHTRTTPYRRTAPALRRKQSARPSGAMDLLLERLPQLTRIIKREVAVDALHLTASDRLHGLDGIHDKVLAAYREAGLTVGDYPLNQDDGGYRSLARWEHHRAPVRTLSRLLRGRLHQLQPVHLSTVRGSVARSVAPYVSLYGTRYSSEVLQRSRGLVGQKIRLHPPRR